jgi:hypothetical protein
MPKLPRRLRECDPAGFFDRGLDFEYAALKFALGYEEFARQTVSATNLTLANELYLKALAFLDGKMPIIDHDLTLLFQDLNHTTKRLLRDHWLEARKGIDELHKLGSEKYNMPLPPLATETYDDIIERARSSFVDLRYPGKGSWDLVQKRLAIPARSEILRRHPEWTPIAPDPREWLLRVR